jgi:hypothetical protein
MNVCNTQGRNVEHLGDLFNITADIEKAPAEGLNETMKRKAIARRSC